MYKEKPARWALSLMVLSEGARCSVPEPIALQNAVLLICKAESPSLQQSTCCHRNPMFVDKKPKGLRSHRLFPPPSQIPAGVGGNRAPGEAGLPVAMFWVLIGI